MDLEPKCRRILKILQNRPDYLCEARHFPSYEIVNFSSGIGKKEGEVPELLGKFLPAKGRTGRSTSYGSFTGALDVEIASEGDV
ncbi:hypothetical protein [Marinobacter gudaonensis]|uniref:hypothetical protein n=1 Tax=Marinobacter gudaonensis TaxID=375760 RepID=UPI001113C2A7|nr:hypothetical protein [Marinobacter gudaonensis]